MCNTKALYSCALASTRNSMSHIFLLISCTSSAKQPVFRVTVCQNDFTAFAFRSGHLKRYRLKSALPGRVAPPPPCLQGACAHAAW